MELNRESIERRDFPVARRGYDPAAVDAHLRALAAAVQELAQRAATGAVKPSLSTAAATQVQGILEAAQATSAEIGREAQRDAQRTREDAAREVERARAHVETLARASTALLAHLESLDDEVSALAQSLRVGGAVSSSEEEGSGPRPAARAPLAAQEWSAAQPISAPAAEEGGDVALFAPAPAPREGTPAPAAQQDTVASASSGGTVASATPVGASGQGGGGDLDGARLVALNMALSGESREQTDRYLADSFQLADRAKLLDEVYAAIEG